VSICAQHVDVESLSQQALSQFENDGLDPS
jgi:hypothetical protein